MHAVTCCAWQVMRLLLGDEKRQDSEAHPMRVLGSGLKWQLNEYACRRASFHAHTHIDASEQSKAPTAALPSAWHRALLPALTACAAVPCLGRYLDTYKHTPLELAVQQPVGSHDGQVRLVCVRASACRGCGRGD